MPPVLVPRSDWPGAQQAVDAFRTRPANANVGFRTTAPPMLCKPLADGSRSPCGLDEFAVAAAAAAAAARTDSK